MFSTKVVNFVVVFEAMNENKQKKKRKMGNEMTSVNVRLTKRKKKKKKEGQTFGYLAEKRKCALIKWRTRTCCNCTIKLMHNIRIRIKKRYVP